MMKSMMTDEALTCGEEQVGVMIRQTGKGVKGDVVNCHKDGGREAGMSIKHDPMSIVVIRHHLQNYSSTIRSSSFIRPAQTKNYR
jgi:hypothetical protein